MRLGPLPPPGPLTLRRLNRERRSSYSAEATALFARMSVAPDATRKGHIDTLIVALKTAGIWSKLDALYILAAHDAQAARLNWVSSSYDCTAVNSPTFTTDRGYTGDGATSYLNTGFNASTAGGLFTQNSAHQGVWVGTNVDSPTQIDCGTTNTLITSRRSSTLCSIRANVATTDTPTLPAATSIGWLCWRRSASANYQWVKNNSSPASTALASQALLNLPFYILGHAAAGPVLGNPSTRRIQAQHFGSSLSDGELASFYAALSTYMTAVGAA